MGKILFFLLSYLPKILSLESLQAVDGSLLQSTSFVFAFRIQATKKPRYKRLLEIWCRMAELNCQLALTKGLYCRYTNPATVQSSYKKQRLKSIAAAFQFHIHPLYGQAYNSIKIPLNPGNKTGAFPLNRICPRFIHRFATGYISMNFFFAQ